MAGNLFTVYGIPPSVSHFLRFSSAWWSCEGVMSERARTGATSPPSASWRVIDGQCRGWYEARPFDVRKNETRKQTTTEKEGREGSRNTNFHLSPSFPPRRWLREVPTITRTRTPHGRTSTTTYYGASRTGGTGTDARCTNDRDVRRERPQAKRGDTEEWR